MEFLLAALVLNHLLHYLEVLCYLSLVSIDPVFQFHYGADLFAAVVYQCERCRHLTYLHSINDDGNL